MVLIESLGAIGSETRGFQKAQMSSNESWALSSGCFGLHFLNLYRMRRRRGNLLVYYNRNWSTCFVFKFVSFNLNWYRDRGSVSWLGGYEIESRLTSLFWRSFLGVRTVQLFHNIRILEYQTFMFKLKLNSSIKPAAAAVLVTLFDSQALWKPLR